MTLLKTHEIPGQTKLVLDYQAHNEWLRARCSGTTGKRRLERRLAVHAITQTMHDIELSEAQKNAVSLFEADAYTIVTGQQVGFLGGALYNIYKIATAISRSRSQKQQGILSVVVFWVEDNDHDHKEAATGFWFTKEQGLIEQVCGIDAQMVSHTPVADLNFDSSITDTLANIESVLSNSDNAKQASELLQNTYSVGRNWTDAFVHLMNVFFADEGVLFVSASKVRELGYMQEIILDELKRPEHVMREVEDASQELVAHGYHIQAKASALNLFVHADGQRHKVQKNMEGTLESAYTLAGQQVSIAMLLSILHSRPTDFSPSVLLRPIVQDYVLGSSEYIAGPSELAYLAQLKHSYIGFDVAMPTIILRSGATVLSHRVKRIMEKEQRPLSYFLRPWSEIEADHTAKLSTHSIYSELETNRKAMSEAIEKLRQEFVNLDRTLDATVSAGWKAIEKELDTLKKKANAALKRQDEESLSRLREAYQFLYPGGQLQERRLSPIFLYSEGGLASIREIIEALASHEPSQHYVLSM